MTVRTGLSFICFFCAMFIAAGSAAAKERSAAASPADELARAAVGAALSGDQARLSQLAQEATSLDYASEKEITLPDAVFFLATSAIRNRDEFLYAAESAATQIRKEELRTRVLLSLLDDEYYEINQLKGQDKFNKFTRIFNRASSSLSKLAMLQPQDAAQLLLDGVYSRRKAKTPSERERRIVYLCRVFLQKYPDAAERPEIEELGQRLREKLDADTVARERALGEGYLEQRNYWCAEFHLENAAVLNIADEPGRMKFHQARNQRFADDEATADSLGVSDFEHSLSKAESESMRNAVDALIAKDTHKLVNTADEAPRLADSIEYAVASTFENRGEHDRAVAQLASVAARYPQTAVGATAADTLRNPQYNLDEMFERAVQKIADERRHVILTGKRTSEDTAYQAGSAALQSGSQAAAGVPFLFATDILVRGIADHFKTEVPADRAIDAAARYLRRYPKAARARQIAWSAAQLSKDAGQYDDAEQYFEKAGGATEKDSAKMREDKARELLARALQAADLLERKRYLEKAEKEYPQTKIMKEVRKQLGLLHPTLENGSVVLTLEMLRRDPRFASRLGIHAALLDGKKSNGELTQEGIALNSSADRFSFRLQKEDGFRIGEVPAESREELQLAARNLRITAEQAIAGRETIHRQKFPFAIEGGAGGSGVEVAPKIIPLKDNEKSSKYFR